MTEKDKIFAMAKSAYDVGYQQQAKTPIKQQELFNNVLCFSVRGFHRKLIWQSYRSGLFSKEHGD